MGCYFWTIELGGLDDEDYFEEWNTVPQFSLGETYIIFHRNGEYYTHPYVRSQLSILRKIRLDYEDYYITKFGNAIHMSEEIGTIMLGKIGDSMYSHRMQQRLNGQTLSVTNITDEQANTEKEKPLTYCSNAEQVEDYIRGKIEEDSSNRELSFKTEPLPMTLEDDISRDNCNGITCEDYETWSVTSSVDVYLLGDRVCYNEQIWESTINYNAWSPDQYRQGWELLCDSLTNPYICETWSVTHSGDVYMIGDKVMFGGEAFISILDFNAWSPEEYPQGWETTICD